MWQSYTCEIEFSRTRTPPSPMPSRNASPTTWRQAVNRPSLPTTYIHGIPCARVGDARRCPQWRPRGATRAKLLHTGHTARMPCVPVDWVPSRALILLHSSSFRTRASGCAVRDHRDRRDTEFVSRSGLISGESERKSQKPDRKAAASHTPQ